MRGSAWWLGGSFCFRVCYICLSIVYFFVFVFPIVYKTMSGDTTTQYWLPKHQQKNCSNDLGLFFPLLGAQFSTDCLHILHVTRWNRFLSLWEISRDLNSRVFHKTFSNSKQPNIGMVFWVTVTSPDAPLFFCSMKGHLITFWMEGLGLTSSQVFASWMAARSSRMAVCHWSCSAPVTNAVTTAGSLRIIHM